jgi:tetratricopeptide (TPR) repeat protein
MARFNLSVVLRQLGEDVNAAIKHCEMLDERIKAGLMAAALQIQPDLEQLNQYNLALAVSKLDSWQGYGRARKIFEDLIASGRIDFQLMGRSGKATSLLFEYRQFKEALRNSGGEMDEDQRRRTAEQKQRVIREVEQCLDQIQGQNNVQTSALERRLALSTAIALNARGYVFDGEGDYKRALEALRRAAAMQPDYVDPHLNLARLFRRYPERTGEDWTQQARVHLDQVLAINPSNRDAHYQMGRLLSDPALADYAKALESFQSAQPHGMSAYQAGVILLSPSYSGADLGKAIEWLRVSVVLTRTVGFQHLKLTESLLKAAGEQVDSAEDLLQQAGAGVAQPLPAPAPGAPAPNPQPAAQRKPKDVMAALERAGALLEEARRTAKALEDRAARASDKKRGTDFLAGIDKMLERIRAIA